MAIAEAPAVREQTRARYPDRGGLRRARRRADLLRGLRRRRADGAVRCRPGRSSTRAAGRCRFPTSRDTAASSPSIRAATGRSDRPSEPTAYTEPEFAADAAAVLDATETARAVVVAHSLGAQRSLLLAAEHPERVHVHRRSSPRDLPLAPSHAVRTATRSTSRSTRTRGGRSSTRTTGFVSTEDFLEFFFSKMFTEPHSTKQIEDGVGWGLEQTPRR